MNDPRLTRRAAVAGAVAIAGLAAGCARYGASSAGAPAAGAVLGKAADVPVGGGTVFGPQQIVVTRPAAGEYRGFSAVCTHQGCIVADVVGGTINCACHGSRFAIADGAVVNGPARQPLPARQVSVAPNGDLVTGAATTTSAPTTSAAAAPALAATDEIPVGGGTVFATERVVVTQPATGQFRCFTAVCTHQGCIVANVANGTINCDCHGSKFNATDGSVANGPACRASHPGRQRPDHPALTRSDPWPGH